VGGKQKRIHTGELDKERAEQLRREKLVDLGRGLPPGMQCERTTYEQLKVLIEAHYTNEGGNLKTLASTLRALDKEFAGNRATSITYERCIKYRAERKRQGRAISTINREMACLNKMFTLGVKCRLLLETHHPHVDLPNPHNRRTGVITPAQMREFLPLFKNPNVRDTVEVTYITGWRSDSDILTRRREHVRMLERAFVLDDGEGKAKELRAFPIHPGGRLEEILLRRLREAPEGCPWIFYRTEGRYRGHQIKDYRYDWDKAIAKLAELHPDWKCEGWIRHRMRYSAITEYLDIGTIQAVQVAKMIGMSARMMARYHHLTRTNLANAGAAIEASNRMRGLAEAEPNHILPFAKKA
jgi:hypothetical protein